MKVHNMNIEQGSERMPGAQSVFRAIHLLKLVGLNHERGISLASLVAATGLDRATAYRLLGSLVQSGMLARGEDKLYRLGLESMQLGLATMSRAPIMERCRPMMIRLARRTEDTVYLVVRNGDYAHCVHYEEGAFPIKALVLKVGGLRLLGVGSAGTALMATLSDGELAEFQTRHAGELPPERRSLAQLVQLAAQIRQQGYASTDNLVATGVSGVGLSFQVTPGTYAAISVGAIRSRMDLERRGWIVETMKEELRNAGWSLMAVPGKTRAAPQRMPGADLPADR